MSVQPRGMVFSGETEVLQLDRVNAFYGKFHALKDASLGVNEGEIVTVIGANGSGKSTLLKTTCGLLRPKSGKIRFHQEEISRFSMEAVISAGICMVPEGREIFSDLSVLENLQMGAYLRFRRGQKGAISADMEKVLSLFPVLRQRLTQRGGTLSGGEQQMLAIARGMMADPRLLLLDEPSLGLAPLLVETIFQTISDLRTGGMTILLVEQNSNMSLRVADRGYVMQTGTIVLGDRAEKLLSDEEVKMLYLGKKAR